MCEECVECQTEGLTLIRQIQPSDYRMDEFYQRAAGTLESIGVEQPSEENWWLDEWANESFDSMCESVEEPYVVVQDSDYWGLFEREGA